MKGSNAQVMESFLTNDKYDISHAGNVYYEGDTIYSFGPHFPMARKYGNIVFITNDWYSVTTSGHQGKFLWCAKSHFFDTFVVPNIHIDNDKVRARKEHYKNVEYLMSKVESGLRMRRFGFRHILESSANVLTDYLEIGFYVNVDLSKRIDSLLIKQRMKCKPELSDGVMFTIFLEELCA